MLRQTVLVKGQLIAQAENEVRLAMKRRSRLFPAICLGCFRQKPQILRPHFIFDLTSSSHVIALDRYRILYSYYHLDNGSKFNDIKDCAPTVGGVSAPESIACNKRNNSFMPTTPDRSLSIPIQCDCPRRIKSTSSCPRMIGSAVVRRYYAIRLQRSVHYSSPSLNMQTKARLR